MTEERRFFKYCLNKARVSKRSNLEALIHYLKTNKEVSLQFDLDRSDALRIAEDAMNEYLSEIAIKKEFI